MTLLPKAIYRFSAVSIKISRAFSTEQEQIILKFVWKHKRHQMATAILRKKNRAGRIRLLDFRLYYRAIEIKIVCYLHKTKNIEQWIRIKKPRNKPTHLWSPNL